ncbi:MAG: dihydroorotase family protein [Methanosphaera sp.]|nr:dihydroorotase family protein [Methanosphaera sp.]
MNDLILKNCKFSDNQIKNIIIENGKIKEITKTLNKSDLNADNIIDIKEKYVIPGLIDPHVHFRDPGLTHKEDWASGSMAAIHGGYTTVIDMPNTNPQTDTLKNFKEKKEIALKKSYCDFGLQAGVKSKKDVDEILTENPASFKIFMDLYSDQQLDELFGYIENTGKLLCLHCEDQQLVKYYTKKLKENPENESDTKAYSQARSEIAELISVHKAISYAKKYNLQLHLCHISSNQTLKYVEAYTQNMNISIEATPHHIFLDNSIYDEYGVKAKTNPPLRNKKYSLTVDDLCKFDSIGTDHAPHTLEEKTKDTWTSAAGIPGLEVTMKLLLTQLNKGKLTLDEIIRLTSLNPSRIFNIENKGKLQKGYDADICVIDLDKEGTVDVDEFYTRGKYTPFEGLEYVGDSIMTINRGQVVCENDEVIKHDVKYIY